ncbi:MAG: hypothetical protein KatS3mg028_0602 [Bacteroidia bacterium]|nr:MAG: hypothetical protein KatS3mg028_0602 [Bacteroidia bacterium]
MEKIKKAYYLLFYKIYRFYKSMEDDGFADWKAKLVIEILHIFILTIIVGQIQLITKWRIIPNEIPKIWIIPILLIIVNFT